MDKKEITLAVSHNLRLIANQMGLSDSAIAKKCGIYAGTISKIMSGSTGISLVLLLRQISFCAFMQHSANFSLLSSL